MRAIFAHFFSWVFLPLLMPVYGLYLTLFLESQQKVLRELGMYELPVDLKWQLFYIFTIFSALLPGISFVALHKKNIITTIDMENQRERNIPLLVMFAHCLVLFAIFLYKAPDNVLPKYFYALPLSGGIVTACFMYINRWIKISMHAGGTGILVGYLIAFILEHNLFPFWLLIAAVAASGLTISSRLYLNKHRPIEVYTGWSLALLITFLCNFFYPVG
jgi:membrane-associated phospholipid phosphatase